MRRKILTGILALVFILQAFIPNLAYAVEQDPQDKKTIGKEEKFSESNLITIGKLKGIEFSKDNPTASISVEKVEQENNHKTEDLDGLEIGDEIVPQAVRGNGSQYIDGQQPADPDKPKYWANVEGTLTTRGIDGTTFDWDKVLGKDAKIKLLFTQTNGYVMTGVTYSLLVDKDGTYTWHGSDGKPTYLPIFDEKGNGYSYNVQIERNYSEDVQLIISESNGTPGRKWREEGDKHVATISFLNIEIQQVASTKFVSEWSTALAEAERPQIEGEIGFDAIDSQGDKYYADNDFNFPKNNTSKTVLRDGFLKNFEEGDEENGPWSFISSELETTPKKVEVKTDTQGLTFEENNGVKTVKSGDHKFKYDFTYDVINGGKLTMTEILPVTFDANGGKFASIGENEKQEIKKEVEYGENLTDEIEKPTKDRETFKGWATSKDGTPLSENDFNEAIKNIKEAKTFYAIWDNNDIVADQLEVKESFKDGTGYVNDFIPDLAKLKKQVKIKDASGTPQALTDDDKLEILDDSGNVIADADLKDKLYEKLKEDDATEVSRNVTLKAKVNLKNGTSKEVEIPIKVVKNIYEAKTETKPPFYVPDNYVKVTLDPTRKAQDPQRTYYYVNPAAEVVIPGSDPVGVDGNTFTKWLIDGTDTVYELAKKPRHKFENETTIKAQYVFDVIPANPDGSKADGTPGNFVKVTFVPTEKGTLEGTSIFYVNPDKEVTILVKDPKAKDGYKFDGWDSSLIQQFKTDTTITAKYTFLGSPSATADYVFTKEGVQPKPEDYQKVITPPKGKTISSVDIVQKPDVNKPGLTSASVKINYTDGTSEQIPVKVYVESKYSTGDIAYPYPGNQQGGGLIARGAITMTEYKEREVLRREVRYMQGFEGKFRPKDSLTRAEAAQILANALKEDGYKFDPAYKLSYKDIQGKEWYAEAIRITTQADVFKGYDDGNFRPDQKITRAEWISTLRRFQYIDEAEGNSMKLRSDHWAISEVEAAYKEGWLKIYQDGLADFAYDKPITRQEVAAVSNKAFNRVLDKRFILDKNQDLINYSDVTPDMWAYEDILCASNTFLHKRQGKYLGYESGPKTYSIDIKDAVIEQDLFQRISR